MVWVTADTVPHCQCEVFPEWHTDMPTIGSVDPATVTAGWPHVFTEGDSVHPDSATSPTPISPSRALTLCVPPVLDVPSRFCCPLWPYAAWLASLVQCPAVTKCLPPAESVAGNPTEQLLSDPGHHGFPGCAVPLCCTGALPWCTRTLGSSALICSMKSVGYGVLVQSTRPLIRGSMPHPTTPWCRPIWSTVVFSRS